MRLKVKTYQDIRDLCDLLGGELLEESSSSPFITAKEIGLKQHVMICRLDHEVTLDQLKIVGGTRLELNSSEFGRIDIDFSEATPSTVSVDDMQEVEFNPQSGEAILYDVPFAGFVIHEVPMPVFTYSGKEFTLIRGHPEIVICDKENIDAYWQGWRW